MSDAPAQLSIRLLGPVEVQVAGRPIAVDTRKAVALLAWLAVTDQPASRESLAALLWPDAAGAAARGALRRTLSVLNSALGTGRLAVDRRAVALSPDNLSVDLREFAGLVQSARSHGHPPDQPCETCSDALEKAEAFDRGEFMAGFSLRDSEPWDEWQLGQAEALRRDRSAILERLARAAAGRLDWGQTVEVARRWLEVDPLHEPAHRILIEAHARSGEPAAAIRQYRACVRILESELGVLPVPETTALYEAVRDGRITLDSSPAQPTPVIASAAADDPGGQRGIPPAGMPFVGRQSELARLVSLVASARQGDGVLVVVTGEAGIGKTRLLDALAESISNGGGRVIAVTAWAGEQGIPFGLIVGLLRAASALPDAEATLGALAPAARAELARLAPSVMTEPGARPLGPREASPVDGSSARLQLLEAIAEALTMAVRNLVTPGLIQVDDLQWADISSLEALAYLGRRLAGRGLILALAWRPEDLVSTDPAVAAIERLPASVHVRLERLSRPAVDELVRARFKVLTATEAAAVTEVLYVESEGLPLYVVEALAAGEPRAAGIPVGVRALLNERLASVGEIAGQILAAAAVVGRQFDPDLVRQASGRSDEETVAALEELTQRGLVKEVTDGTGEARYDFGHSRLRDAEYERLSLARRRLIHRRVADAIRLGAGPRDERARLSLLAHHERSGGREIPAADAYVRAGELAQALYANREALAAFEAALTLGHPDAVRLHEEIGVLRTRLGDYGGALAALEAAAASAGGERLASIERRLGQIQLRRGDLAAADSHIRAALEVLGPGGSRVGESELVTDRAVVALRAGDAATAARLASDALGLVDPAIDPGPAAAAHRLLGLAARAAGQLDRARAELLESLALATRARDDDAAVAAGHALALVELGAGNLDEAADHARTALAGTVRSGDRHLEAAIENSLADVLHAAGRDDESMDHLKRAVALFAQIDELAVPLEPEIWKLVEW